MINYDVLTLTSDYNINRLSLAPYVNPSGGYFILSNTINNVFIDNLKGTLIFKKGASRKS